MPLPLSFTHQMGQRARSTARKCVGCEDHPCGPSSAARPGFECREQNSPPLTAGAAQGPPAFVFALHPPLVASCCLIGMGATSSLNALRVKLTSATFKARLPMVIFTCAM